MIAYILPIIAVLTTASLGSWLTNIGLGWYNTTLKLPDFTPSGVLIGSVWSVLFALLAISWCIYRKNKGLAKDKWIELIYWINCVLNITWTYIFFYSRNINGAFKEIWLLNFTILLLIGLLWRKYRISAYMLIPYLIWVSFATYLNYSILVIN